MDIMWILSIAAIVALAVVFTRVLTVVIKGVILAGILYLVFTKVDIQQLRHRVEKWTKPYSEQLKKLPVPHRPGKRGELPAL